MQKRGISQEGLKLIACITMLIDHIGATLVLRSVMDGWFADAQWGISFYYILRIIGRIAFPIYCFLLVEGAHHTRDPKKYALRLFVSMLLSEIPFDLAFNHGIDWASNSVMITLLLGFLMIRAMMKAKGFWKVALILPFYFAAELLNTDYAGLGILVIAVLALTKDIKHEKLLRLIGLWLVLSSGMKDFHIGPVWISLESLAIFALIPIFLYNGRKLTHSRAVQWAFYLFYPVHIAVLALLEVLIFG